jgi:antitoxin (DNA-binding transcriptional repressor) of toxin-antitoxin stability system
VPIEAKKERRKLGTLAGQFQVPDDFDDPLPDEILDAFEGR